MKKITVIIAIVFAAALFWTVQSYGLILGPARFEVSLPPGEIAEGDYYVQNDTEDNVHVVVEPENCFKEAYDYGKLAIKDWVELNKYEFNLNPKEIKKLRLKIKVPKDVKGELAAQIFFTSTPLNTGGQPGTGIKTRLGAVLYVAIKGTEIVDAEIKSITVSKNANEGKEKLQFEVNVKNNGNVHIRPAGKIVISNKAGKGLVELELKSDKPTLPGEDTPYDALWGNPGLKPGEYKVSVAINYGKELDLEKAAALEKTLEVSEDGKVIIK
jgi:hypothetical protein